MTPDKLKYLEFIQATISRQASHSFTIKGWSLTLSTAVYVYTAENLSWLLASVALLPPVGFAWLDAFHLRQERLYRELFAFAVNTDDDKLTFDMNAGARFGSRSEYPKCGYPSVYSSRPWLIFHGIIVGGGVFILGIAIC